MELTKSRRKRVGPVRRSFCQSATRLRHHQERNAPRMPGIGIADRYLMNFHRIVGLEVSGPRNYLFYGRGFKLTRILHKDKSHLFRQIVVAQGKRLPQIVVGKQGKQ